MVARNFRRKKVKSLTLGEKLRQLRKDRRMRVFDLSRKIHVKDTYITALENGDYESLPTKVYVKGFVRSYARFFGVPEDVLLSLFEREYSVHSNINFKEEESVNRLPKVPKFVLTPKIIFGVFAFMVLAGVGVYLYYGVDSFISSPWLVIDAPAVNAKIEENHVVVEGRTRNNSRVTINGQQVFVDMEGGFSEDITLAQGVNVITVKSVNRFNKESVQEITVDAQYEITTDEDELKKDRIKTVIKADAAPVWVNVSADGVEIYNDTLQIDEEKEFDAVEKISITTSSGKNTLFMNNNGDFVSMSDKDEIVKDWIFPMLEEEVDKDENEDTSLQ